MEGFKATGWQNVYKFTFIQMLKSKSFKVLGIIFCILALISMPVVSTIMADNEAKSKETSIKKVYIIDESPFNKIDYQKVSQSYKKYRDTVFTSEKKNFKEIKDELLNEKNNDKKTDSQNSVYININYAKNLFKFDFAYSKEGNVKKSDVNELSESIRDFFFKERVNAVGLSSDQLTKLNEKIGTKVEITDMSGNIKKGGKDKLSDIEFGIIYAGMMILFFLIMFFSGFVSGAVILEKTNKVVEYLLISIKPLAIIIGKILAAFSAMLLQIFSIIGCLFVSVFVAKIAIKFDAIQELKTYMESKGSSSLILNFNFLNVIIAILIVMSGLLFFSLLGGLTGASVSRVEDIAEGTKILSISAIIGFYIDIALVTSDDLGKTGVLGYVAYWLPLSSPFIMPAYLLLGKVSMGVGVLSLLILIVADCLLFRLIADVYENMIYYKGTMKIKEILRLSKVKRKERKQHI